MWRGRCCCRGDEGGDDVVHLVAVVLVQDVVQIAREGPQRGLCELFDHVPRVVDGYHGVRFAVDKRIGMPGCPSVSPAPPPRHRNAPGPPRHFRMFRARETGELPGVVDVVVPGLDHRPLTVAAAVADSVHGVHRVAVRDEPAGQRALQPEMFAVPMQQHHGAANLAVRQLAVVVDPATAAEEE